MILLLSLTLAAALQVAVRPAAPPESAVAEGLAVARLATSLGATTVELSRDRAPFSVENFLHYAWTPDDAGHAGIGRVVGAVKTESIGPHEAVPVVPVVIKNVTIER